MKLLEKIHKYLKENGVTDEGIKVYDSSSVFLAMEIMEYAHKDQRRENGEEYANHPQRVLGNYKYLVGITNDDYFCIDKELMHKYGIPYDGVQEVCILHDVVEDTEISINDIEEIYHSLGFADYFDTYIKEPLINITHIKNVDYMEYIKECLKSPISSIVKMMDLQDNLRLIDLVSLDEKNYDRSQRYVMYFYMINSKYKFLENISKYRNEIGK